MKKITPQRIDVVKKAGDLLVKKVNKHQTKFEMENHFVIGNFLKNHPKQVLKLIIKLEKRCQKR